LVAYEEMKNGIEMVTINGDEKRKEKREKSKGNRMRGKLKIMEEIRREGKRRKMLTQKRQEKAKKRESRMSSYLLTDYHDSP
jgi:hypothetical protein